MKIRRTRELFVKFLKYQITNNLVFLGLLTFCIITSHSIAQRPGGGKYADGPAEGIITGIILDKTLDLPMEYANIVLYSKRDSAMVTGTVSDVDGHFKLENIPFGRYYAFANFIGYNKTTIHDIRISPNEKLIDLANIYLEPAFTNLEGVEVVADKEHLEYRIDKKIVNVSQDILGAGGSAVSVLENIPSVQVDIEGNVSLRGTENFQVLVDGKPSVVEGSDALQQIPASTIDHIEIITNPSAKYDPDGVGGIINVVLKKQKQKGINGVVNASLATGNKYSIDALLNYRTKHVNIFGGLDYNFRDFRMEGNSKYETYYTDSINFRDSEMDGKMNRQGYGIRGGLDYYVSDKSTLTFTGRYGYYGFGRNATSSRYIYSEPLTTDEYSQTISESERGGNYYRMDANYLHKFDDRGHQVEALFYYSSRKTDDWELQEDYLTDDEWNEIGATPESIKTIEDEMDRDFRIKADYVKPLGKEGKLEAGYQSRFEFENEVYTFLDYDYSLGEWINNADFSSEVDFTRNIHAVYAILSNGWKSIGYQLGLRGEYTDRSIENVDSKEAYIIDRFDYFPTVHLSREFRGKHQLLLSYGRRIERPGGRELDPFPNYMDAYNIRIGNPALEPEYIDSYELGYQKRFEKSFVSLEGYYRITKNKITRIKTLQDDGTFIHTYENLNKDFSLGAELMVNADITRWLNINIAGNIYNYRIEGSIENEDVDGESTNWDTRANITMKFKPAMRFQLTSMYDGPTITAQGERKGFYMMSAAVRKDFFNGNLSATLSIRDIFQTAKREYISSGVSFYSYDHFVREAPVVSLNVSYLINNYKQKRNGEGQNMDSNGEGEMEF